MRVIEKEVTTTKEEKANNELVVLVKESGLEETKARNMLATFQGFFDSASEWEGKIALCKVTNREQKTEMKIAREGRLHLRSIRINVENKRKELKEQSLREGKAIDGIANVLKGLIVPLEEKLESYEKFAELEDARVAEERRVQIEELRTARTNKLEPFNVDISCYNLGEMTEETFSQLFQMTKKAHEDKIAEERRAEKERITKEKAEAEAREAQRLENERLKKEAEAKEKELEEERAKAKAEREAIEAKAEAERKAIEEKARKEREIADAKAKKEREEQEAILKKEREEREKVESELRAKAEQERKETEAKAEAERKAKSAPDKDKLLVLASNILSVDMPAVESEEARAIIKSVKELLSKVDNFIQDKIKTL